MLDFFCPRCGDFTFEDITCNSCSALEPEGALLTEDRGDDISAA